MKVEDVKKRVQAIKDNADDDEVAHGMEDTLHQAVLAEIAGGAKNAAELAEAALQTRKISFSRWMA